MNEDLLIIREKRNSIRAVWSNKQKKFVVRMPLSASCKALRSFLSDHHAQMEKIRRQMREMHVPRDQYLIMGKPFRVKKVFGKSVSSRVVDSEGVIVIASPDDTVPSFFEGLNHACKTCSSARLMPSIDHFAALTGLFPSKVSFRTMYSRWGSASVSGRVSLNAKLVLLDVCIAEYVILHELTHLSQPDHSPLFWNKLACFMADYKERRRWLQKHGIEYLF